MTIVARATMTRLIILCKVQSLSIQSSPAASSCAPAKNCLVYRNRESDTQTAHRLARYATATGVKTNSRRWCPT